MTGSLSIDELLTRASVDGGGLVYRWDQCWLGSDCNAVRVFVDLVMTYRRISFSCESTRVDAAATQQAAHFTATTTLLLVAKQGISTS